MKKFIQKYCLSLIAIVMFSCVICAEHYDFIEVNKQSIAGTYIKDIYKARSIEDSISYTQHFMVNSQARQLELRDLEKMRKDLYEPAKELNEIEWFLSQKEEHSMVYVLLFLLLSLVGLNYIVVNDKKAVKKDSIDNNKQNNLLPIKLKKQNFEQSELSLSERGFHK